MSFIALTSLFELYLLLTKKQTVYQLFILNFYCYLIFVTVCFRMVPFSASVDASIDNETESEPLIGITGNDNG